MNATISNSPRFALYGILGTYNYGTESIIRGTEVALRAVWPDCEIVYVSPRPDEDRRRLQDSGVDVIPRVATKRGSLKWGINAAFRLFHQRAVFVSENMSWLRNIDCVLSVGGDLYTLPPQATFDSTKRFYATQLLDIGQYILNNGIPFVVWGASIGPFEAWPLAKKHYVEHLSRVTLITAREPLTIEYLNIVGISDTVCPVADPAFLTPIDHSYSYTRKEPSLPLVGINLSPLSVKYALQDNSVDTVVQLQATALVQLALRHDVEIVLLPHVISEDVSDDDLRYLQRIYEIIQPQIPNRVGIISDDPGVRKMKGILAQCDAVIAARMHCGIHAASVGTPVLFLAYSAKSRGMAHYIYGDDALCIPLEKFVTSEAELKVATLLAHRASLREQLRRKQPRFIEDAHQASRCLYNTLTKEHSLR